MVCRLLLRPVNLVRICYTPPCTQPLLRLFFSLTSTWNKDFKYFENYASGSFWFIVAVDSWSCNLVRIKFLFFLHYSKKGSWGFRIWREVEQVLPRGQALRLLQYSSASFNLPSRLPIWLWQRRQRLSIDQSRARASVKITPGDNKYSWN